MLCYSTRMNRITDEMIELLLARRKSAFTDGVGVRLSAHATSLDVHSSTFLVCPRSHRTGTPKEETLKPIQIGIQEPHFTAGSAAENQAP